MKILIVGGGSAGWIAASYLAVSKQHDITLIESDNIPIIGVGESCIPGINDYLEYVGVTEQDLFDSCNAVRKYAIEHNNWNGKNETWRHRFCTDPSQHDEQDYWMDNYIKPDKKWRHAYHLDATKLGTVLRDKSALPNGVKHIIDDIITVNTDSNGVTDIVGKNGTYSADLYIDCTGFRSLVRGSLGVEYLKHDSLINNYAVCGPGQYRENEKPLPYTQTFSMDKGWRWRISLQHRTGNGYVFNSDIISIEDAKKEFIEKTPGLDVDKVFVVKIHNGYNPEPWKQNVVSLGLSSGFLEPLESTGLFLVHGPVTVLNKLLGDKKAPEKFNSVWKKLYKEITYFLSSYYKSSELTGEYWGLFEKIEEITMPKGQQNLFVKYNYQQLADSREIELIK